MCVEQGEDGKSSQLVTGPQPGTWECSAPAVPTSDQPLDRTGGSIQITELSKDDAFGAATPRWTEHHVGVLGMILSLQ